MRRTALILAALCWVGLAGGARASLMYEYVTDKTTYSVLPNHTLTVNLYLQETATGGSSSLLATDGGLFGAGLFAGQVGVVPANGRAATITGILPNAFLEPNGFTGTGATGPGGTRNSVYLSESVSLSYAGINGPSGTTTRGSVTKTGNTTITDVFLGQLTVAAGSPGSTTTFDLLSLFNSPTGTPGSGFNGNTLTFTNFYDLDPNSSNPAFTGANAFTGTTAFTFQVTTPIPEPTSLALFLVAALGMGAGRAWRRHTRQTRSSPDAATGTPHAAA